MLWKFPFRNKHYLFCIWSCNQNNICYEDLRCSNSILHNKDNNVDSNIPNTDYTMSSNPSPIRNSNSNTDNTSCSSPNQCSNMDFPSPNNLRTIRPNQGLRKHLLLHH